MTTSKGDFRIIPQIVPGILYLCYTTAAQSVTSTFQTGKSKPFHSLLSLFFMMLHHSQPLPRNHCLPRLNFCFE